MLRLFRVVDNRAAAIEPKPSIFPGYVAPIVRQAADGEREVVNLNWGFVLLQKGLAPRRVTNVVARAQLCGEADAHRPVRCRA
jgi:hypothetical protein